MKRIFTRPFLLLLVLLQLGNMVCVYADPSVPRKTTTVRSSSVTKKKARPVLYNGYRYYLDSKERKPFSYTRTYNKSSRSVFVTTYRLYDKQKQNTTVITATHDKAKKSITVSVRDLTISGWPVENMERTSYDVPYMGLLGSGGKVGAIGNATSRSVSPNQLAVKFAGKKYEQVKVVYIAGAHEQTNVGLSVYILDEKI